MRRVWAPLLLLSGCGEEISTVPPTVPRVVKEETVVATPIDTSPASRIGIPPIDANGPARTETATFALG